MKYMYFHNGNFTEDRHITVRRGDRWFNMVRPGEQVEFVDFETESVSRTGKILGTEKMRFDKIPEEMLTMSSNPECKTKDGLLNNMRSIYEEFQPEEDVTVIFFEVK